MSHPGYASEEFDKDYGNHPNIYDRVMHGKEVSAVNVPAQHQWQYPNELVPGDGIYNRNKSWVVKSVRSHDKGVTAVVEPRAGFVGRSVVSQLQFGVQGITMEDTDEQAFTFPYGRVLPVRM